jgi:RHS repeat-associated protein
MSDRTGTTTYRYDETTSALKGIDKPNGSGVEYGYDLMGRMKTLSEWTGVGKPRYTTTYDYDGFGNLKSVLDPAGGLTTMKYDVVNRLEERSLPNGVKTSYEYDDLDRAKKITHTNTVTNQVLSSVTYEREGIGEPTKITREDNTYVKLKYDESLRVEKESYYDANNTLIEEISYTYDGTGKRTSKRDRIGTENYNYKAGFQLDTISGVSSENYDFDANGRLTLIQRDGQTIDLEHDGGDRLTSVENETTGKTTQYTYDGAGKRVRAIEGSEVRQFLVAPAMGSGLESSEAIGDASGNLVSNYIYAGGHTPFMMLDTNGNPVYYLTDAMGSVIGLSDTTGQEVAEFRYDAFGNSRGATGSAANAGSTKGDFRFQGQWLESESGIYYFRARDYDAQTGTFISRDPVNIIETEPESFNPYQFVYNNPYVYSDPEGLMAMSEINVSKLIQDILNNIERQSVNEIKDRVLEKLGETVTGIVTRGMDKVMPYNLFETPLVDAFGSRQGRYWDIFEWMAVDAICRIFGDVSQIIHLQVSFYDDTGKPADNGISCSAGSDPDRIGEPYRYGSRSSLDYVFKQTAPTERKRDGLLSGDVKMSVSKLFASYVTPGTQTTQWNNAKRFAKKSQYVPINLFVTWNGGKQDESDERRMIRESAQDGVIMFITSILKK